MVEGTYHFEVIGGPFDGVQGFRWRVLDAEFPLPESIKIGTCIGGGGCGQPTCAASAPRRHAAYWTEDEDPPVAAFTYVLEEDTVREPNDDDQGGRACYALGGLDVGRRLESSEMVPVG